MGGGTWRKSSKLGRSKRLADGQEGRQHPFRRQATVVERSIGTAAGFIFAQLLLQMTEHFEDERLVAQVVDERLRDAHRDVLNVVETQRASLDAVVADRLGRERLVDVVHEVVLIKLFVQLTELNLFFLH